MLLFLDSNSYINTEKGFDISLPLTDNDKNPRAWYVEPPVFEPVRANGFIGSVEEGGNVNFRNIFFNPHGHGTHTECLGHITEEVYSVNKCLKSSFFKAKVISVQAEERGKDLVITKKCFPEIDEDFEALIIRTLPNNVSKKHQNYSSTNPAFLNLDLIELLEKHKVKHLLIDLPSVDKEEDGGVLAFHHAFWQVPENPEFDKTITELIFVSDEVEDGNYILNLQTAPFENDASPSRPVLFKIENK
jgi:kynurenine formamidase